MLPVIWTDEADEDLAQIAEYIAERNPKAAMDLTHRIIEDADNLGILPATYRRGRVAGTHEFVSHPNYILIYRITTKAVEIVNVLHTKRRYPKVT
jgi:toxin ParE1/3/4